MLYGWQMGELPKEQELRLPDDAAEYLTVDNPRLQELRQRYSEFQSKASLPIVWTDEYVKSYCLQSFRGDNCYVWQASDPNSDDINYCLTSYYVKAIDKV